MNEPTPPRRVNRVPRPEDAEIGDVIDGRFFADWVFDGWEDFELAYPTIVLSDRVEVWVFVRITAMCVLAGGSDCYAETVWQRVK